MFIQSKFSAIASSALVIAAGCAGAFAIATPLQAATFSLSESSFAFFNFSVRPSSTATDTFTDTLAISFDGETIANAEAGADFFNFPTLPSFAENFASSVALGEGFNYLGEAESESSLLGLFQLDAGETFSFDFQGSLTLIAGVDRPQFESAQAFAGLGFLLESFNLDGEFENLLDEFSLSAFLDDSGDAEYEFQQTAGIVFDPECTFFVDSDCIVSTGFIENLGVLTIDFSGTYSREFSTAQLIQLSEDKAGLAIVSAAPRPVPEPSIFLGLALAAGIGGFKRLKA